MEFGKHLIPSDLISLNNCDIISDEKFSKAILLIDDSLKIHIFPETRESLTHLREKIGSIYLHFIDQESNNIKGYVLTEGTGGSVGVASVNEAWSVKFPDDQSINKISKSFKTSYVFAYSQGFHDYVICTLITNSY